MISSPSTPEVVDVEGATTAVIRGVVPIGELVGFFDRSFSTLAAVTASQKVGVTGPAFALYHEAPEATADLEVGFPTAQPVAPADTVEVGSLPAGPAARLIHRGSYDELGSSWERLARWMGDEGLEPGPMFWEIYVTEPSPDMDPADLRTELVWPLA